MAKQTLPTNFVDDILSPSMGGKRKYRIIDNDDGTYSLEDVTDYTQTGSDFGAGQINATNQAVNESCDKANVIDGLNDVVANQADGMIAGAKSVKELHDGMPLNADMFAFETFFDVMYLSGKKIGKTLYFSAELFYTGSGTTMQPNQYYKLNRPGSVDPAIIPKNLNVLNVTATNGGYTNAVNGFSQITREGLIQYSFPSDPVEPTYIFVSGIYETQN